MLKLLLSLFNPWTCGGILSSKYDHIDLHMNWEDFFSGDYILITHLENTLPIASDSNYYIHKCNIFNISSHPIYVNPYQMLSTKILFEDCALTDTSKEMFILQHGGTVWNRVCAYNCVANSGNNQLLETQAPTLSEIPQIIKDSSINKCGNSTYRLIAISGGKISIDQVNISSCKAEIYGTLDLNNCNNVIMQFSTILNNFAWESSIIGFKSVICRCLKCNYLENNSTTNNIIYFQNYSLNFIDSVFLGNNRKPFISYGPEKIQLYHCYLDIQDVAYINTYDMISMKFTNTLYHLQTGFCQAGFRLYTDEDLNISCECTNNLIQPRYALKRIRM